MRVETDEEVTFAYDTLLRASARIVSLFHESNVTILRAYCQKSFLKTSTQSFSQAICTLCRDVLARSWKLFFLRSQYLTKNILSRKILYFFCTSSLIIRISVVNNYDRTGEKIELILKRLEQLFVLFYISFVKDTCRTCVCSI